jgi:bacteriocin biosynthesis cyclodehydratase domain-containing protein
MTVSQLPPLARVGPMHVPGRTGCYECQEAAYRAAYPLYDEIAEQRARGGASPAAAFGPARALVGGHAANEIGHLLSGLFEPATLGRSASFDLRTLAVGWEDVPAARTARCARGPEPAYAAATASRSVTSPTASRISSARRAPSSGESGVAAIRMTTCDWSISSTSM